MPPPPSLLLVDDDEHKRFFLETCIRRQFGDAMIMHCTSGAEAIAHLAQQPVHAIVTNHSMHPVNGIELTRWVRARFPALPIVMVTGNPIVTREALQAGASRVLSTADYPQLGATLETLLSENNGGAP
ncbi:response regulator [Opitutus terrae]|uniref:Response regulator receiver protein n=1 Tax=Opitutus terrae (strain DSM 11246 / JCM 15787 / PB90-1) TaxID=452637 RepID=B1ZPW0_OPITP|nr:response regulator [Opitutus terrae]ACB75563.1 response regulator receiver protein [Opitutus terrae PB90-1]